MTFSTAGDVNFRHSFDGRWNGRFKGPPLYGGLHDTISKVAAELLEHILLGMLGVFQIAGAVAPQDCRLVRKTWGKSRSSASAGSERNR